MFDGNYQDPNRDWFGQGYDNVLKQLSPQSFGPQYQSKWDPRQYAAGKELNDRRGNAATGFKPSGSAPLRDWQSSPNDQSANLAAGYWNNGNYYNDAAGRQGAYLSNGRGSDFYNNNRNINSWDKTPSEMATGFAMEDLYAKNAARFRNPGLEARERAGTLGDVADLAQSSGGQFYQDWRALGGKPTGGSQQPYGAYQQSQPYGAYQQPSQGAYRTQPYGGYGQQGSISQSPYGNLY